LTTFTDKNTDPKNLGSFVRTIGNHEYTFLNGQLILKTLIRKNKFLSTIKPNKKFINKILTLDIETRDIKNKKYLIVSAFMMDLIL
jgi:hypothetical protein